MKNKTRATALGEGLNVVDRMCCCNPLLKANGVATAMLLRVAWVPALYCHRVARSDDSYLAAASRADAEPSSTSGSTRWGLCGLVSQEKTSIIALIATLAVAAAVAVARAVCVCVYMCMCVSVCARI